jgi:hypothetical protein
LSKKKYIYEIVHDHVKDLNRRGMGVIESEYESAGKEMNMAY